MPAYLIFELIALIASLPLLVNKTSRNLKLFVPFLIIIVIYEFGNLQGWFTINKSNLWSVNLVLLLEFLFYSWLIRDFIKGRKRKIFVLYVIFFVILMFGVDIIYLQGFWKLDSYAIILSSLAVVAFVCIYLLQLLEDESINLSLTTFYKFWIATGIFFYYLATFSFFVSFQYMAYKNNYSYLTFFRTISIISNFILYSCLAIAFICQYKRTAKL